MKSKRHSASHMVRVDARTHFRLRRLAETEGVSITEVLARALEAYRQHRFWDALDAAAAKLRSNSKAWEEELKERALWEGTLGDDLEEK